MFHETNLSFGYQYNFFQLSDKRGFQNFTISNLYFKILIDRTDSFYTRSLSLTIIFKIQIA